MTFFLAWVKDNESFDAGHHCREDEEILSFSMCHHEGDFPLLEIEVFQFKTYNESIHHHAFFSYQNESGQIYLLFSGYIESFLTEERDNALRFFLSAKKPDSKILLYQAIENMKTSHGWDELLVDPRDRNQLEEVLDHTTVLPHWDRCSGFLSFSDVLKGRKEKDLGENYFEDGIQTSTSGKAITKVNVQAKAEWVQLYEGLSDISPVFDRLAERGLISTLTPEFFKKSWWKKGFSLRNSGYDIVKSGLLSIIPPSTGQMDLFPLWSKAFETKEGHRKLPRVWFQPQLVLHWEYRQKRQENLIFSVSLSPEIDGVEHSISVNLEKISLDDKISLWQRDAIYGAGSQISYESKVYECVINHRSSNEFDFDKWRFLIDYECALENSASPTFFLTLRGNKIIDCLIEKARSYILGSMRTLSIRVEFPFEDGIDLDCDTDILLRKKSSSEEVIQGKVKEYGFVGHGDKGRIWAYVVIGVVPDQLKRANVTVGKTDEGESKTTSSGIIYRIPKDGYPKEGILHPEQLTMNDLVIDMRLENNVDQQNDFLSTKSFSESFHAIQQLQEHHATRLSIALLPLKGVESLVHTISL